MSTEKAVTTTSLRRVLNFGAANGRSVATLAHLLDTTERAVRTLSDELVEEGVAVCAHPKTGYFIAATEAEAQATRDFLVARGEHSVNKGNKVLENFRNASSLYQSLIPFGDPA